MEMRRFITIVSLLMAIAVLSLGFEPVLAQDEPIGHGKGNVYGKMRSTTQKQRKAAAANAKNKGLQLGAAGTAAALAAATAVPAPSGTPDYFGPYSNYANSPLPGGTIASITLVSFGSGYNYPIVTVTDLYGMGSGHTPANATLGPGGAIAGITGGTGGTNYVYPVVTIVDNPANCGGTSQPACGTGATATATIGPPYTGGMQKFVDTLPTPTTFATPTTCPPLNPAPSPSQQVDCYEIWEVEYRAQLHSNLPQVTGNWGLKPDNTTTQTGGTLLRGYVQVNPTTGLPIGAPSYLGPVIKAERDKPVRVTFKNKLPFDTRTGATGQRVGDLFIPVDTSYMGAGNVPDPNGTGYLAEMYRQNRAVTHLHGGTTPWISDGTLYQWTTPAAESTTYPKGVSIYNVPDMPGAGDVTTAPQGTQTFFYTNEQSARLMFYHDHAVGLTRINVYAGMAAGYLLTDPNTTRDPIPGYKPDGTNALGEGIPLIIQDKTFVWGTPGSSTAVGTGTWATDPTWDSTRWGGAGNLWFPHVYMTNQNPWDITGANAMGRWDYGPWFWPPFTGLIYPPIPNIYCQPAPPASPTATTWDCSQTPWEPPFMPGVPSVSGTPESFMDTPVVNGKAYPTLTITDPTKPVRFRILSVGNDRMLNLSLWVAADKTTPTTAGSTGTRLCTDNSLVPPANCTEVKMVPFNSTQNTAAPFPSWWYDGSVPNPFDDRVGGVPDPDTRGPAMIQIATEGGFLPAPVVIKNQPVNYVMNKRDITVGNVAQKSLFLGPAERADVIVDFSNFAGKTLILYNDAPAPVPAADLRLDYFTGNMDTTDTGGAPSTLPGYGPNTRTIMQIVVACPGGAPICASSARPDDVNTTLLTALQGMLPPAFKASQDTIIVPQAAYNQVYGTNITDATSGNGQDLVKIQDTSMTFTPLNETGTLQAAPVLFDLRPKAIIEDFQIDYGRMNALLGVEIPKTNNTNQTSIPQGLMDPPTEVIKISDPSLTPIGTTADGTQIWKITHNGVDTHAIHVHMFTVQVVNRVGWDGAIRLPDANELGFKDTIRMNPLEDIIVAVRPINLTNIPFKIPNSWRPLAPDAPLNAAIGPTGAPLFFNIDPAGNPIPAPGILNQKANFGWEHIWHCHILGHEENDMMRATALAVAPDTAPSNLVATGFSGPLRVHLTWTDNSVNETAFTIQRSTNGGAWTFSATVQSATGRGTGATITYDDSAVVQNTKYNYMVLATNVVGSAVPGYPQEVVDTAPSNVVTAGPPELAPSGLTATQPNPSNTAPVVLSWTDNSPSVFNPPNFNAETSFTVQRSTNGGTTWVTRATLAAHAGTGPMTYTDPSSGTGGVQRKTTYTYRILATNIFGSVQSVSPATATITTR